MSLSAEVFLQAREVQRKSSGTTSGCVLIRAGPFRGSPQMLCATDSLPSCRSFWLITSSAVKLLSLALAGDLQKSLEGNQS